MLGDILPIVIVLLWAGSKYVIGLGFIFYYDFTFLESLLLATLGGMLGILFFSYCGDYLKAGWQWLFPPKKNKGIKINKKMRFLVKVRRGYGLAGIAFLTPVLLTVPVGAIMANALYKNKIKIFTYMFLAFTFWSLLFCGAYHMLDINISAMLFNV